MGFMQNCNISMHMTRLRIVALVLLESGKNAVDEFKARSKSIKNTLKKGILNLPGCGLMNLW